MFCLLFHLFNWTFVVFLCRNRENIQDDHDHNHFWSSGKGNRVAKILWKWKTVAQLCHHTAINHIIKTDMQWTRLCTCEHFHLCIHALDHCPCSLVARPWGHCETAAGVPGHMKEGAWLGSVWWICSGRNQLNSRTARSLWTGERLQTEHCLSLKPPYKSSLWSLTAKFCDAVATCALFCNFIVMQKAMKQQLSVVRVTTDVSVKLYQGFTKLKEVTQQEQGQTLICR